MNFLCQLLRKSYAYTIRIGTDEKHVGWFLVSEPVVELLRLSLFKHKKYLFVKLQRGIFILFERCY